MAVLDAAQPTAPPDPGATDPNATDSSIPTTPQGPPQPDQNPNPAPPTTTDPNTQGPAPATTDTTSGGGLTVADIIAAEQAAAGAAATTTTKPTVHEPEVDAAKQAYFKIWGVMPPKGYIEGLVHQGLNVYEIVTNEKAKPAYAQTQSYRDQWASYAQEIASVFGRR